MSTSPERQGTLDLRIENLIAAYGEGGGVPARAQWQALLKVPEDAPVTVLNFFKFRAEAQYDPKSGETPCSGQEAFSRYAAVSAPALEKVGGRFLLLAPFGGSFIGDQEDWDFVVAGTYPNRNAVLALFEDQDYRHCYIHRLAACERQRVLFCPA
ncbi:DUF1330 domain-containing protein [Parvibaculum sp.]|jgi:uncharacterized protein (DUF1330 family)|uniref:DUF1330 domain-containing protein n=1 Tax=Parvibaculum sp. TaxID=2024848 RepID=UPI002FDA4C29